MRQEVGDTFDKFRKNQMKIIPRPTVLKEMKLDDKTRQVLYSIIQRDTVASLALSLEEWRMFI